MLHCCVTWAGHLTSLAIPLPGKANNPAPHTHPSGLGGLRERRGSWGAIPGSRTRPPGVISAMASSFCRASQEAISAAGIRSKKLKAGAQESALAIAAFRAQRAQGEGASWLRSHSRAAGDRGFWRPSRPHSSQHCWEGLLLGDQKGGGGRRGEGSAGPGPGRTWATPGRRRV